MKEKDLNDPLKQKHAARCHQDPCCPTWYNPAIPKVQKVESAPDEMYPAQTFVHGGFPFLMSL